MQAGAGWRRALERARGSTRAHRAGCAMMIVLGDVGWVLFFVGFAWEFVIRPLLR
jgi:hypothetical protein